MHLYTPSLVAAVLHKYSHVTDVCTLFSSVEKCSTGVVEMLLALSSNCCGEAREAPTTESGVVGAITSATENSVLWGAVQSWREKLGQLVEEQLHSDSRSRGLSEEEELEVAATGITGDLGNL